MKLTHESRILTWNWSCCRACVQSGLSRWQRAGLGAWDLSSAPAALAGRHKINGPSHFHLQHENGKKEGSQLVKIWVSAMSNNQADDPTATRRQTTQSGMLLMLTTFPLYPAHWLCWWVQPLGPYRPAPAPISCVPLNCCFSLQTLVSSSIKRNKMIDPRRLTISWASYAVRTQPVATDSTFLYRTGWEFMKFEVSWCW